MHRVATLDRTPADVVQRVLEVMRKKVKDLGLTTLRSEPKAWVKAAASLLNNLGGGDKAVPKLTKEAAAELCKDAFITAGERDIYTGDAVEVFTITKDGVHKERFALKRD